MILKILDNSNKPHKTTQCIKADYTPNKHITIISLDADVVTLGIVATFLTTEFRKKRNELPTDLTEQLDEAIRRTLENIERGDE